MDSCVRGASFGSVLWAVDSSLTVSSCWPVPYIHTAVCLVCLGTERLLRLQSPDSLGNRENVSLRPTLEVLSCLTPESQGSTAPILCPEVIQEPAAVCLN